MLVALFLPVLSAATPTQTPPLGPAARAVMARLEARAAPCTARLRSIPPSAPVAVGLGERAAVDDCLRGTIADADLAALPAADRQAVFTLVFRTIARVDALNTAYLKSVLPSDGWFRRSRDGEATAHAAWLIVQHSPDPVFQDAVLARMEPLARAGEVSGVEYALLYDRSAMFAGRPQYYGSQYRCEQGRWALYTLRDAAGVEARRRAMGMDTLAENLAKVTADGGC